MGAAVVHFEVMGTDVKALSSFYSQLFDWDIKAENEMGYGVVDRKANSNDDGIGIGGGVGQMPDGMPGYVTFYVEVPDVEASLAQAESLGGTRLMGPEHVMGGLEIGMFSDPEGHPIGVIKGGA
jgi:predicted enzyme related to lactoylglutathione lyase